MGSRSPNGRLRMRRMKEEERGEGGEGFISRRDGSSYEIDFSNDVAHLSFLSFFFERVHAYFPAPGVFIFYVGQPRNIRENRVVVPSTDGPWP